MNTINNQFIALLPEVGWFDLVVELLIWTPWTMF